MSIGHWNEKGQLEVAHASAPTKNRDTAMRTVALALCASLMSVTSVNAQPAAPATPAPSGFVVQQSGDRFASRIVGLNIQSPANETIGEIYDIVITDAGVVKAFIVSVGGFLGIGTRYVAIDPKAIIFNREDERNWKATMNTTKDQLRAAPEYKYESEWRRRK